MACYWTEISLNKYSWDKATSAMQHLRIYINTVHSRFYTSSALKHLLNFKYNKGNVLVQGLIFENVSDPLIYSHNLLLLPCFLGLREYKSLPMCF